MFGEVVSAVCMTSNNIRKESGLNEPVETGSTPPAVVLDVLTPEEVTELTEEERNVYFTDDLDVVSNNAWTAVRSKSGGQGIRSLVFSVT